MQQGWAGCEHRWEGLVRGWSRPRPQDLRGAREGPWAASPCCHLLDPSGPIQPVAKPSCSWHEAPQALLAVEITVLPPNTHRGQRGAGH